LLLIPFFGLFIKWSFKSWGHNFYEHVVMNAFILAYYNIIAIVLFYPILYFFKDNTTIVMITTTAATMSFLLIVPYFFKQFYSEYPFKQVLKRFLIFLILASIFSVILFILVIIGYVTYISIFNPDLLKQFAPKNP
jgi:hypothetical protein